MYKVWFLIMIFAVNLNIGCVDKDSNPAPATKKNPVPLCADKPVYPSKCYDVVELENNKDLAGINECLEVAKKSFEFNKKNCRYIGNDGNEVTRLSNPQDVKDDEDNIDLFSSSKQKVQALVQQDDNQQATNKEKCRIIKAQIDTSDLKLLDFNDDCSEVSFDSSIEKTKTIFEIEAATPDLIFNKSYCNDNIHDYLLDTKYVSRAEQKSHLLNVSIYREREKIKYNELKSKYIDLDLNWSRRNRFAPSVMAKLDLNEQNYAKSNYSLKAQDSHSKEMFKTVKYILFFQTYGQKNNNGSVLLGSSISASASLSNIGYCYLTNNGEQTLDSEQATEKLSLMFNTVVE